MIERMTEKKLHDRYPRGDYKFGEEDNIQIKFKFIVFKNNKNKYFHKLISSQYNMINNIYGTRLEGMW